MESPLAYDRLARGMKFIRLFHIIMLLCDNALLPVAKLYRISSKERPGRSSKSQPSRGGGHSRGRSFTNLLFWGRSIHVVDKQTQSLPIVVSRHINPKYEETGNTGQRESIKKPYEKEKITKQYKGKGYKTISILSSSSISISLHSGVVSAISCSETSLSNGFKSGSLKIDNYSWNISKLAWHD